MIRLCWDVDRPVLYTCTEAGAVHSWDARTGGLLHTWLGHAGNVLDMDITRSVPSTQQLAAIRTDLFTLSILIGVQSIAMTVSVGLSVCEHISATEHPNVAKFPIHAAYCHSLVLLWWHFNILCTSGFIDQIMVSFLGSMGTMVPHDAICSRFVAVCVCRNTPAVWLDGCWLHPLVEDGRHQD